MTTIPASGQKACRTKIQNEAKWANVKGETTILALKHVSHKESHMESMRSHIGLYATNGQPFSRLQGMGSLYTLRL